MERPDCPCCKVCAVGSGGTACDPDKLPCDANKGLECDAATSTCKGRKEDRSSSIGNLAWMELLGFFRVLGVAALSSIIRSALTYEAVCRPHETGKFKLFGR